MKMKMTKKKTVLLSLFVVSIIALAGIGYAAANYTSQTVNSSNTATANYITATQNSWTGNFGGDIAIATYTDTNHQAAAPIYVLDGTNVRMGTTNYYGIQIGTGVTVTVAEEVTATIASWSLDATMSESLPSGWEYFLKIQGTGDPIYTNISDGTATETLATTVLSANGGQLTISLFIAGTLFQNVETTPLYLDTYTGHGSSTTAFADPTLYTDAKVIFTLTATTA